ncbi:ATPase [Paenibacillus pectinilyticus]|uniref:ATPase n=1 Tax=Paenibacillus pectinilyticus TaxID=512399 RepID=A0A1C0ZT92_9BACL|nr:BadF/BadG/BcrA/BcrD ATPase family protein [Paenibacillus pectinilyticus]OCT11300.1 ATPase [Paenibacillus pectinilyticus]
MKRYAVGLDGGGTKTAVTIVDESGNVVHTFTSGAINYNGQDEASVGASLAEIFRTIASVCGGLDQCAQVCIGAAGISNPTVTTRLESSVRACGYTGGLFITGDQETALCGAHNSEIGMILIAGTGSIGYGKNEAGETHRTGGYGYLIDDEGSGYSIGRDLLSAVVRAHDGRLPATVITSMVLDQLEMTSIQQVIGFVYDKQTNKKDIAALAPILTAACELGDRAALLIAERSARELLELIVPIAEKLSLQNGSLAMAGSVLLKNGFVQTAFIDLLKERYPAMSCITPKRDAASGAALMALNRMQA